MKPTHALLIVHALYIVALVARPSVTAYAQEHERSVSFSGQASVSGTVRRYPFGENSSPNLGTDVSLRGVLTAGDLKVPLTVFWNPSAMRHEKRAWRIGIHPEIFDGRLRGHAGDHTVVFSDLVMRGAPVFGFGLEGGAGRLRAAFHHGRLHDAWRDTSGWGFDLYDRELTAARIGFGDERASHVDLNAMRVVDDPGSLDSASAPARENFVVSSDFVISLFSGRAVVSGEAAVAATTNDVTSPAYDGEISVISSLISPRISSRLDGAGRLALRFDPVSSLSLTLATRWIGPGYTSLAQPYERNDLFEATLNPVLVLVSGDLYLNGSIGIQHNNLRRTREATSHLTIGSLFGTIRFSKPLSATFSYFDHGMRTAERRDSGGSRFAARSLSLAPSLSINGTRSSHTITIAASLNDARPGEGSPLTRAVALDGGWRVSSSSGISLSTEVLFSTTAGNALPASTLALRETASYELRDGRIVATISAGLTNAWGSVTGLTPDLLASSRFSLGDVGVLTLSVGGSRVAPPTSIAGTAWHGAASYQIGF